MSATRLQRYTMTGTVIIRRYGVLIAATLLVTFGAFFVYNGRGEIADALGLIASISPTWIVGLALLQALVLLIAGVTYQVLLRRQGHEIGLLRLLEIHLQRILIGTVTPVGGPASLYVLVRALRTHRVSDSDSLIVASIRSISGSIAFVAFLVPALLLQTPSTLVLISTATVILTIAASVWCCVIVLRTGDAPAFVHRWAPQVVLTFIETAKRHQLKASDFLLPTLLGFISHTLTALMLFAGLQAVGYPAALSTVLIGYVVGKLFFMIAPIFQGIGIVEIGLALALQQAGVPAAIAVSGALLYRIGDVWMPFLAALSVHLVRTPLLTHLREAADQAGSVLPRVRALGRERWSIVSAGTLRASRLALVTEAPLALMAGAILIASSDLSFML